MSTYKRGAVPQFDENDAFAEARRREELAGNVAHQTGVQQALAQELRNAQGALDGALADLKRVSLNRDTTPAGRQSYDRCHLRVIKAAERVASMTDVEIEIPAWLPPPSRGDVPTIKVGTPRPPEKYTETGGGKGAIPGGIPIEGSAADHGWLDRLTKRGAK